MSTVVAKCARNQLPLYHLNPCLVLRLQLPDGVQDHTEGNLEGFKTCFRACIACDFHLLTGGCIVDRRKEGIMHVKTLIEKDVVVRWKANGILSWMRAECVFGGTLGVEYICCWVEVEVECRCLSHILGFWRLATR